MSKIVRVPRDWQSSTGIVRGLKCGPLREKSATA
jgi:hypothetical protein